MKIFAINSGPSHKQLVGFITVSVPGGPREHHTISSQLAQRYIVHNTLLSLHPLQLYRRHLHQERVLQHPQVVKTRLLLATCTIHRKSFFSFDGPVPTHTIQ